MPINFTESWQNHYLYKIFKYFFKIYNPIIKTMAESKPKQSDIPP
jgi:hypothetical protein